MKDQYFGDINDYRKYGLLRALARDGGLSIAVCWMLTPSDGRTDGRFTEYLQAPSKWESFDPPLFRFLRESVVGRGTRQVSAIENSDLLPSARYYSTHVPDAPRERGPWFEAAMESAHGSDLVFFDPDNGVEVNSVPHGAKGSSKYIYWREVTEAYRRGHSLLVYQHFPRQSRGPFAEGLSRRFRQETGAPAVLTLATPHVLFVLVPQPHHLQATHRMAAAIRSTWKHQVAVEEYGQTAYRAGAGPASSSS